MLATLIFTFATLKLNGAEMAALSRSEVEALDPDTQELTCRGFTDGDLTALLRLKSLKSLELAAGSDTYGALKITDAGAETLARIATLETLKIPMCILSDKGFATLAQLKQLRHLNVSNALNLTDAGVDSLAHLAQLRSLDISDCRHTTDKAIESVSSLPLLRTLNLNKYTSQIKQYSDAALYSVARMTQLESLELCEGNKFSTGAFRALSSLGTLRSLVLTTQVSDADLEALSHCSALTKLAVGGEQLSDAGFEYLGKLSHLQNLDVWYGSYSGTGFHYLAGLRELTTLQLSAESVSDDGFKQLPNLPVLVTLNLHHATGLTDAGLRHLSTFKTLRALKFSWCDAISKDGLSTLRTEIPQAQITSYMCPKIDPR
jgi:Leucine-rich repeat (LRR) protein